MFRAKLLITCSFMPSCCYHQVDYTMSTGIKSRVRAETAFSALSEIQLQLLIKSFHVSIRRIIIIIIFLEVTRVQVKIALQFLR